MPSHRVRRPSQAALHMPPDFRAEEDVPSGARVVPKWRAIVLERQNQAEGKSTRLRKARLGQDDVLPWQGEPEKTGHE